MSSQPPPDKSRPSILTQPIQIFERLVEPSDEEFKKLRDLIRQACGIALGDDKRYLITQRLSPLLRPSGCKNYMELMQKASSDAAGAALRDKLIEAMTTNETSFFRDIHPFEAFRDNIVPMTVSRVRASRLKGAERKARIWCAASSTGQEPYSIAMLLNETLCAPQHPDIRPQDVQIVATDISTEVLARAQKGEYNQTEISRGLSDDMRRKYFSQSGQTWTLSPSIRRMVEFRPLNLIKPFASLGSFDVIFCRNVLIYFDEPTKAKILEQFHEMLVPGGALLLGAMENTYCLCAKFHSKRVGKTIVYEKL